MPELPPMPKQYSARIVRSDGLWTMVYEDGWTGRIESYNGKELVDIVISRSDKSVIWSLDPKTKTYRQSKLPKDLDEAFSADVLFDWIADGFDVIEGKRYQRFVGRLKLKKGMLGEIHEICFLDPKTNMRRREVTVPNGPTKKPSMIIDYLDAVIGKPSRALFEMPEGYKRAYFKH